MSCCADQLKLGASVCASLFASLCVQCASLCASEVQRITRDAVHHQVVHQDLGSLAPPNCQSNSTPGQKYLAAPPPSTNTKSFDTWTFQEIALRSFCAPRNLCAFESCDFLSVRCWWQAGAFVYAELRSRSSLQTINRGKGHVWTFGQRRRCDLISSTGRQFLIRS